MICSGKTQKEKNAGKVSEVMKTEGEIISPLNNINIYLKNRALIVESQNYLRTLNSSVLGGGFRESKWIINLQVKKGYDGENPREDLVGFAEKAGLDPQKTAGMMTAAQVADVGISWERDGDLTVMSLVTAGVSNALAAGGRFVLQEGKTEGMPAGTINTIVLIDGNLTEAAMVNAVITLTEAKALVLQDLKVKDVFSGEPASGTSTDAVIVAVTGRGDSLPYAGSATRVGGMIGRTVRKAAGEAVGTYLSKKNK